jgi:uncharacterized protein YyaL (SSP411 family)
MTHVWEAYRAESGGLRDTPREQTGEGFLVQEMRPIQDTPTPSPNGVAGIVLARLHAHTDDDAWRARRDELLGTFAGAAAELSIFGATLLRAIDWAVMPSTHVVARRDHGQPPRSDPGHARRVIPPSLRLFGGAVRGARRRARRAGDDSPDVRRGLSTRIPDRHDGHVGQNVG